MLYGRSPIGRLLLFDACMPHMERCHIDQSCKNNPRIFCVHRLGFDAEVIYANIPYIGFLRFSDLQILLHFLYQISDFREYGRLAPKCTFHIVTKDLKFKNSVRAEWEDRKRSERIKLQFQDNNINVQFDLRGSHAIDIFIITLPTKNRSPRDSFQEIISKFQK